MTVVDQSGLRMGAESLNFSIFRGGHGVAQTIGDNVLAFGKFDGVYLLVGKDFQFGRGGAGGISTIRKLLAATGLDGVEVGTVEIAGSPVSASRIRTRLAVGDIDQANELLGRRYEVPGRVDAAGWKLASLVVPPWRAVPAPGGYLATIRPGHQRSRPLLHGQIEVFPFDTAAHHLSARWNASDMRGPPRAGPVLVTFGAKS